MNVHSWVCTLIRSGLILFGSLACSKKEPPEVSPENRGSIRLKEQELVLNKLSAPQVKKNPPAPDGSIFDTSLRMWIQTCSDAAPCSILFQNGGENHCKALKVGSLDGWQLPSKETLGKIGNDSRLENLSEYHWSSTEYSEDSRQYWIVDPSGKAQSTTIPKDRKKFLVRCIRLEKKKQ